MSSFKKVECPSVLLSRQNDTGAGQGCSAEPAVAFGMQKVIAEAPGAVAKRVTDFFSGKTIGQLSLSLIHISEPTRPY